MLNCREVTRSIAADQVETASWGARLGIRLHLLMCRHCRRYAEQLRSIGALAGRFLDSYTQDRGRMDRLKSQILERLV